MDLSALESKVKASEISLDLLDRLITLSTFVVVAGLIVEYWFSFRELLEAIKKRPPFPWKKVMEFSGGVLVVLGVAGELWYQSRAATVQTSIRADSQTIEGLLDKEAAEANERAKQLEKENLSLQAEVSKLRWRKLSDEQKAVACSMAQQQMAEMLMVEFQPDDQEAKEYSRDFAAPNAVCPNERIRWEQPPMEGSPYVSISPGVWISISPEPQADLEKRKRVAALWRKKLEDVGIKVMLGGDVRQAGKVGILVGPRSPHADNTHIVGNIGGKAK
jgi:hypothetical protein